MPTRRSRTAVGGMGLLAALAGFGCGAATPPPGSAQIVVHDDRIDPPALHVPAGSTVRWLNAGGRDHRIESDTRHFDPFEMAPRANHDVEFREVGRFPYTVDRVLHGVVVVDAAQTTASRGGGGHGADGSGSLRRYEVALSVTSTHRFSTEGEERALDDNKVVWTCQWPDVTLEVMQNAGETRLGMAGGAAPAVGNLSATVDYHHMFPSRRPIDCAGQFENTYRGQLWIGGIARSGDASIDIHAGPDGAAGPSETAFERDYLKRCGGGKPSWPGRREFPLDSGLIFELTPEILGIRIHREHSAAMFTPFDRILAHQAFEVTTGARHEEDDRPRSHDRSEWEATIRFAPR